MVYYDKKNERQCLNWKVLCSQFQVELGNLQDAAFLNAIVKVKVKRRGDDTKYVAKDLVTVVGYPLRGDTISVTSYAHGSSDLLGIEIDATINPGSFVPEIYNFTPFFIDTSPIYGVLLFLVLIEKENLYLYGLPNETWKVNLPIEEVPSELPEPALGINHGRDGMQKMDWLSLVSNSIV
ncbi:hypothetical protein FEM48_Zijuj10G0112200 [Ziziphus jujuba var. spinosa]|uniref:PHD finger protein ALFIN-LIKE n=1 Tax=Ziziphus jujuba var. spinosa TaxID=714518 RepID=A0A978UN18_ZIZJJ|nr:hypothetical protein FEM48_Zijuj10G0112200 [Ziziphus jujuba var. spinosa]